MKNNILKSRTAIGIVCILLALAGTFGAAPLVNRFAESKTEIVRIIKSITQGQLISESDIEVVSVGAYNLPSGVLTDKNAVIGKYAAVNLCIGDSLFADKLSDMADSADEVFHTLDGSRLAMSITISSFAGGLSGKLMNGDIVSLMVYNSEDKQAVIPSELTYVKVITTTTSSGFDKDELAPNDDGSYELPTTLTLLVTPEQARLLTEYENSGKIHVSLVFRGDADKAQKFLDKQDGVLADSKESSNE